MMQRFIAFFLVLFATLNASAVAAQQVEHRHETAWASSDAEAAKIPAYANRTLNYIREYHAPPPGYEGGRVFGNFAHTLPMHDRLGHTIRYEEWDVKPHAEHRNRGAERIVTGSDGRAWYTRDHYQTFIRMQ